jgi:hypothetical protein
MPRQGTRLDLTDQRYARLTALVWLRQEGSHQIWWCRCECGRELEVRAGNLRSGNTKSCGCLFREGNNHLVHGHARNASKTPGYNSWNSMIARCTDPDQNGYEYYGGKGIKVCDRWRHGENGKHGFECFLEDMGPRPPDKPTIGRRNSALDYEPSNCRWESWTEQGEAKRLGNPKPEKLQRPARWVYVSLNGQPLHLSEALRILDATEAAYYYLRKRSLDPQKAIDFLLTRRRKAA